MVELLEGACRSSQVEEWKESGGDSFAQFKKNLKTQPEDWYWKDKKITYSYNSQGYRCPEWDAIDWSQSILFFGCSFIFGVGVSDEDTCASQLQEITGIPVINLGCPGSSPMFQWVNSVRLRKANINPLKVIYSWPSSCRVSEFKKYPDPILKQHWGPWRDAGFGNYWIKHRYVGDYFLKEAIDCCDMIWNCPVYHLYINTNRVHIYDYVLNSYELPLQIDYARDLAHPGINTFRSWASYIESIISQ